ncbi:MAG: hypothetical protein GKR93_19445, partial [Gammaproteobacteria bacterium]|nr:hypothetical protein [Gammaproteobacteria bacterium]
MLFRQHILLFSLLCLLSNTYGETAFVPARFTDDPKSLQNKIKFPDIENDIKIKIFCDTSLSRKGNFRLNFCFGDENDTVKKFEIAVHRATRGARIQAASVNGKTETIWFQYSVLFVKKGKEETIRAYPNHGWEVDKYGQDYSSPQRYIRTARTTFKGCHPLLKVWLKTTVDKYGVPKSVEIDDKINSSVKGEQVVRVMEQLNQCDARQPLRIQVDNGSEFISKALDRWAY